MSQIRNSSFKLCLFDQIVYANNFIFKKFIPHHKQYVFSTSNIRIKIRFCNANLKAWENSF